MIPDNLPIKTRAFRSDAHRRRGTALTQVLLVCLVVFSGTAAAMLILRPGGKAPAGEAQEKNHEHGEKGEHAAKGRVELTPEKLRNAHLTVEEARPATIHLGLRVFGKVVPDGEKLAHVSPRYAGVARKVNKRLGDTVAAGEVLASVESNESLQTYDLKAPLAGTIIERDVTVGEFVGTDKSLFTVADLGTVWVDFQIYQQDFSRLRVGQPVRIGTYSRVTSAVPAGTPLPLAREDNALPAGTAPDGPTPGQDEAGRHEVRSTVAYLSPFGAETTQTTLARAYVPNRDGALRPGLFVTGEIAVDEIAAAVAVREDAVQTLDGKEVVFVEEGDGFEARAVQIGARDGERAQVLAGLKAGDRYVAGNAFLLKAEIGKEGAEHED